MIAGDEAIYTVERIVNRSVGGCRLEIDDYLQPVVSIALKRYPAHDNITDGIPGPKGTDDSKIMFL